MVSDGALMLKCGLSCVLGVPFPLADPRASGGKALLADQLRRSPAVADSLPEAAESGAPPGGCCNEGWYRRSSCLSGKDWLRLMIGGDSGPDVPGISLSAGEGNR